MKEPKSIAKVIYKEFHNFIISEYGKNSLVYHSAIRYAENRIGTETQYRICGLWEEVQLEITKNATTWNRQF